ncbi:MAG: hypothetical protein HYS18_02090 [Burkholderiales bacterium]|nr:hypothetical protein [Burkholderiales bacterium]
MPPSICVTKDKLLEYVVLEEDEDTAVLLKASSFLYIGAAEKEHITYHYWSYPTSCGVAWVSFSTDLTMRTESEVPSHIQCATRSRDEHPIKQTAPRHKIPVDRTPIAKPVLIPYMLAPVCDYYPVWNENIPFENAANAFEAKPVTANVGYVELSFCVKLSSGRFAQLTAPAHQSSSVSISLEMFEDARSREDENCIGFVHVQDIKEILAVLGREYVAPTARYPYEWR